MERIAAVEQQADRQLMEAALRKDAQEEAADKQAKAERKAEQLRYRCAALLLLLPGGSQHLCHQIWQSLSARLSARDKQRNRCNDLVPLHSAFLCRSHTPS